MPPVCSFKKKKIACTIPATKNTAINKMKINVFILCYNEEVLLPNTIKHYRTNLPNCKITILDNKSTDKSVKIAKSYNCEVIEWESKRFNGMDTTQQTKFKNDIWKNISNGWVIVIDMDEWLCVTERELQNEQNKGTTILSVKGVDIIGESKVTDLSDVDLFNIRKYVDNDHESKNLCFFRDRIQDMNFTIGAHHCSPVGIIKYSEKTYINKHMNNLGEPYIIQKTVNRFTRSIEQREKYKYMSVHYIKDINKIKDRYNDLLNKSKDNYLDINNDIDFHFEKEPINLDFIDNIREIPDFVEIKFSSIAGAGLGIFAKKEIFKGQFLGNYVGELSKKNNIKEWNQYLFSTVICNDKHDNSSEDYIINAESLEKSNWTRFINCSDSEHEQNIVPIRCNNTEIYSTSSHRHLCMNGYIMFYALKDISEGSELFFDYGNDYKKKLNI